MTREDFLNSQDTTYSDWFGTGDLIEDLKRQESEKGELAINISRKGYMILIEFSTSFVCTGHGGNEYHHTFDFDKPKDSTPREEYLQLIEECKRRIKLLLKKPSIKNIERAHNKGKELRQLIEDCNRVYPNDPKVELPDEL